MAEHVMRIQLRRGTAAEWAAANPVLSPGEPGFETDTSVFRIGDGVTPWSGLPAESRYVTEAELAAATGDTGIDPTAFVPKTSAPLYLSDFAPRGGLESASDGMRAALEVLGQRGGGELVVDGTFLLDRDSWAGPEGGHGAAVYLDGKANSIVIRGYGSESVLILRGPSNGIMLNLGAMEALTFENLTFYGAPQPTPSGQPWNITPDCKTGILVRHIRSVTFDQCYFVGIVAGTVDDSSMAGKGAVLYAYDAPLVLRDCLFSGCGGTIAGWRASLDTPVVRVARFGTLVAENCRWMDVVAGGFKGSPQFFRRQASAWVKVEDPWYPDGGMRGHNVRGVVLRNCHFDEAVGSAVHVQNSLMTARLRTLRVESCSIATPSTSVMNNGANKPAPLFVVGVDDVTVEDCFFGDFGSLQVAARFEGCDNVVVDGATGAAPVTRIQADDACGVLAVRNLRGTLVEVDSRAARTDVQTRGLDAHDRAALLPAPVAYSSISRAVPVGDHEVLTPGRLHLVAIELPKGLRVSEISFFSGSTAAGNPSHQWFGLFDGEGNALAVTEDDTGTAWGANSRKTLALGTPHLTTYAGLHYLGVMVAAGTAPSLVAVAGNTSFSGHPPVLAGQGTGSLTSRPALPFSTSLSASRFLPFAGVS